jgi:hypothetical protein
MKKVYPCRVSVSEEESYVQYLPFEEFKNRKGSGRECSERNIIDFFWARERLAEYSIQKEGSGNLPLLIS